MTTRVRYLLDTNVISETRRKNPNNQVLAFFHSVEQSALHISVLTIGELRKGAALKKRTEPDYAKKLGAWIDELESRHSDRVLGIDKKVATLWGEWSAQRPRSTVDTLLAATAAIHDLTFVTRNTGHVDDLKIKLLNPWGK